MHYKYTTRAVMTIAFVSLVSFVNFAAAALVPCQRGTECTLGDLMVLALNIINYLLLTSGIVVLLFMVYGGVRMLTSGGNPESLKAGKGAFYNALLGFIIILTAYIVLSAVINTLSGGSITNVDNLRQFFP